MSEIMKRIYIHSEMDVAFARLQAREVAKALGFGTVDQARISLATSELARNMTEATPGHPEEHGEVLVLRLEQGARQGLAVEFVRAPAKPGGPPVRMPDLVGVRHLVDECTVQEDPQHGTHVTLIKWRPN